APPAGPLAEHGHGLTLVSALTLGWGWHTLGTDQKQVWCKFAVPGPYVMDCR
ncbi:ATP-binding protein, partial [Streptomyces sp. SB3404]|nr:ATP-binding protein [Streptomyces boncukensis]